MLGVALVMQRVVRELACRDVRPDVLFRPLQQRADLVERVAGIPFDRLPLRAADGLCSAHTSDPGLATGDGSLEGLDLADMAARQTLVQAVVETVDAAAADVGLEVLGVRVIECDVLAVTSQDTIEQRVGFLVQATGVDAEDVDREVRRPDQVGEDHGFGAEAVRVHDIAEVGDRLFEQRTSRLDLGFQLGAQFGTRVAQYGIHRSARRTWSRL